MQAFFAIISVLCVSVLQISLSNGGSFVPQISEQWPWRQWTTTTIEPPKTIPTLTTTTTQSPIVYSSGDEDYVQEREEGPAPADYLIVTDPNTAKSFTVPSTIFWSKLGNYVALVPRLTTTTTQAPQPPKKSAVICDFYIVNCWNPRENYGSRSQNRFDQPPLPRKSFYGYSNSATISTPYGQSRSATISTPYGRSNSATISTPYGRSNSATISTLYGLGNGYNGPRLLGNTNSFSKSSGRASASPYWKRDLNEAEDKEEEITTLVPLIRVTRPSEST